MTIGGRLKKIQSLIASQHLDLAIVSSPADIHYLTQIAVSSVEREATLYITPTTCVLLHSPLLTVRASATITAQPALSSDTRKELISRLVISEQPRIGAQETDLHVNEFKSLKKSFKQAKFVDISNVCAIARSIKSAPEIESLRKAGSITAAVMKWVVRTIGAPQDAQPIAAAHALTACGSTSSITELDFLAQNIQKLLHQHVLSEIKLTQHIEMALGLLGSQDLAFPVHVAFDEHTASPHHQPGNKLLKKNAVVMLDFGAKVDGYCADMTRTICLSPTPPDQFVTIKKIVDLAYEKASEALSDANSKASQIDKVARHIITQAGYGKYFPHSTGHGVGLEIHEQPSISPSNHQALLSGMVITIEPGIYLPNQFGYRTEDTVLVTA
jgi:Xaa-Pro dipeptidase